LDIIGRQTRQVGNLVVLPALATIVHGDVHGDPRSFASERRPRIGKILNPNGRFFKIFGPLARNCWLALVGIFLDQFPQAALFPRGNYWCDPTGSPFSTLLPNFAPTAKKVCVLLRIGTAIAA